MDNMLRGFGVHGYRSFGPEPQFATPLAKINIFAGQNNSGKSNILRLLGRIAKLCKDDNQQISFEATLDLHKGRHVDDVGLYLPLASDGLGAASENPDLTRRFKEAFYGGQTAGEELWFAYDRTKRVNTLWMKNVVEMAEANKGRLLNGVNVWQSLWSGLTGRSGGDFKTNWWPGTIEALSRLPKSATCQIYEIEAHRRIGVPGSTAKDLNGDGIISKISSWQHPKFVNLADSKKFDAMNSFLGKVTGDMSARLNVPHTADELLVEMHGRLLPISSLGTGIHEVIIFAAAATSVEKSIVCIEEPKIHLHPRLQRRLLQYLQEETTNQYFITTHAASLLDAPDASIFHLRLNEFNETVIESVRRPGQRALVAFDLGNKASDLMQANAIVWVEGPSDRIYVNAWIASKDSRLQEGFHYAIMSYGGSLLAHMSADDDEVKDFVKMLRINRNVAILMDSDRSSEGASLKPSPQRLSTEVQAAGGLAWITAGREVENYLHPEELSRAHAAVHPRGTLPPVNDHFTRCYPENFDKVKIAREACKNPRLDVLDLEKRIDELVAFIQRCNC